MNLRNWHDQDDMKNVRLLVTFLFWILCLKSFICLKYKKNERYNFSKFLRQNFTSNFHFFVPAGDEFVPCDRWWSFFFVFLIKIGEKNSKISFEKCYPFQLHILSAVRNFGLFATKLTPPDQFLKRKKCIFCDPIIIIFEKNQRKKFKN